MNEAWGQAAGGLFPGGPANVSWERALEGLGAEDAARVPPGLPHSVAQIAAHVAFWQRWLLQAAASSPPPWPAHASGGWPEPDEWTTLRAELLVSQDRLRTLATDPTFTASLTTQGQPWAGLLVNFAGHGVYHLGQVVQVRQALGLWPPPSGGDTW